MVLELLINPKKIQGKSWEIFFLGFVYSFIAVFLSLWIFKGYVSIVMVTLTVIASVPFVHRLIELEEGKDLIISTESGLLRQHSRTISIFLFLFLGFVTSFCLLYLLLPMGTVQNVFSSQINTIITINSDTPIGSFIANFGLLNEIIVSNLKILFFCIAFSFFYGAGAIFILTWNASVMAAAIGSFIRSRLIDVTTMAGYMQITSLSLLQYMLHGIPEIIAYFVGGLASGIISIALMNHDFMGKKFKHILNDALSLVLISILILIIAALIEVFMVPIIM